MDGDLALAVKLQEELYRENGGISSDSPSTSNGRLSLADQSWELMDPNPDIRALFLQYNDRFFWGRLAGIEVKWSPRMTLCAGLCVYEGRGGLCSVRLSLPLLKLRPRRDLVQTLLHEMIHAYLFVTDNNKDHDGHGPEFHKHMYRINKEAGVNITVYHTFHDEVAEYRQHWWRCNGPCQNRKPYFGFVKRAMNRPPGPRDPWFRDHQNSCNGTFIKVKEPENYGKKKKKGDSKAGKTIDKSVSPNKDIRAFFGKGQLLSSRNNSPTKASPAKDEQGKAAINSKNPPKFYDTDSDDELDAMDPQKKLTNVRNNDFDISNSQKDLPEAILKDLLSDSDDELLCDAMENYSGSETSDSTSKNPAQSKDVEICDISSKSSLSVPSTSKCNENSFSDVQNKLREVWGKKFENLGKNKTRDKTAIKRSLSKPQPVSARKKIKSDETRVNSPDKRNGASSCDNESFRMPSRTGNILQTDEPQGHPVPSPSSVVETEICRCPVCSKSILVTHINQHLDGCLGIT